jgi:subtilisin-like proprotein convertase family protein
VGKNGVVHIGYYDTRNSTNRTGVDFFYTNSVDSCQTWAPEVSATSETSENITDNFEWGDYNGLSVVLDKIAMAFTDNRPGQGVAAMVISGVNPKSGEEFNLSSDPNIANVCPGTSYTATITVDSTPGYAEDVTLSFTNVPSFVANETLSPTLVPAPGTSTVAFDLITNGTPGVETLSIQGLGPDITEPSPEFIFENGFEEPDLVQPTIIRTYDLTLNYLLNPPPATLLISPADAAIDISGSGPIFEWEPVLEASGYTFELASDMAFTNILETAESMTNSYTSQVALTQNTIVYWRVTTKNACGNGTVSDVFSFTTSTEICFSTATPIPDDDSAGVDATLTVSETGIIDSIRVSFESNHTWPGDLKVDISHLGTPVNLMNRVGSGTLGCNQGGVNVLFDDTSAIPVDGVCNNTSPGVSGTVEPEGLLGNFTGLELAGDWVLNVSDNAAVDTGDIVKFCLQPVLQ